MSANECEITASDEPSFDCVLPPLQFLTEDYRGITAKFMGDLVTVEVGANKAEFKIHKELICQQSKFFARATSEAWNSSHHSCAVRLPEDRVHLFALFVDWLYDRLPQELIPHGVSYAGSWQTEFECGDDSTTSNAVLIDCSLLVDLYIFADRVESPSFQNTVMDRIRQNLCECIYTTRLPPLNVVKHVYSNTPKKSPLRQIMADAYGNHPPLEATGDFMSTLEDLPQEFIVDVFRIVAQEMGLTNHNIYHVENSDGLCSLCKSKPASIERGRSLHQARLYNREGRRRNSGSAYDIGGFD